MRRLEKTAIALYFLLCPLEMFLNVLFTSSTKYVGIIILGIWICNIIYNATDSKLFYTKYTVSLSIWIIYFVIVTLTIGVISEITFEYLISYTMMGVLVIVCCQEDWKNEDIAFFLQAYYIGCMFMALLVCVFGSTVYEGRTTVLILGRYCDPNQLAASFLPGIFISADKVIKRNRKTIIRFFHMAVLAIEIYAILSTGTRGGFLSLLVCTLVFVLIQTSINKRYIIPFVMFTLLAACIISQMPLQTIERIKNTDTYLTGSGRTDIWKTLISSFDDRWILGHGIGSTFSYFKDIYGKGTAVHNTFLLVLYESGIVGLCLYLYTFLGLIIYHFRSKNALVVVVILSALICSSFLDSLNFRYLWNGLIIGIIVYNAEIDTYDKNGLNQNT